MAKSDGKSSVKVILPRQILITQPKPESPKSPYFELEKKYGVELCFVPFISLEGIDAKEFRKQKVELFNYTAVIFTSKNAIDHFFRVCEEMKISMGGDTKYFCITEAVALYLQKFILYRKRKVFYGSDGTNKSLFDAINKHKENEKFIYPCSENQQDGEIVNWLKTHKCDYVTAFMYRTVSADVKEILKKNHFDIMCFFTPSGVKSLLENQPKFKQNGTVMGAFGNNTTKALEEAGMNLTIKAPAPESPSMIAALDRYLNGVVKAQK
jgi:uroporphyrinogen-III synthase